MMQTNTLILLAAIFISLGFSSLDENGKVLQKVSKEENGEEFIEISIKRTSNQSVKISQNLREDDPLDGIDYFVKNNLNPSQFNYYPNPNHGRFNLKFSLKSKEEVTIKIMDILGNEVYKEKILDFQGDYDNRIDLSGKEKGLYILQIHQKKKMFTRKILIE